MLRALCPASRSYYPIEEEHLQPFAGAIASCVTSDGWMAGWFKGVCGRWWCSREDDGQLKNQDHLVVIKGDHHHIHSEVEYREKVSSPFFCLGAVFVKWIFFEFCLFLAEDEDEEEKRRCSNKSDCWWYRIKVTLWSQWLMFDYHLSFPFILQISRRAALNHRTDDRCII